MNIGNVGSKGGVDRGGDLPPRADSVRNDASRAAGPADRAAISADGRDAAASLEARVAAVASGHTERADLVARAMQRLMSGELDRPETLRATAEQLAAAEFRTV